MPTPSKPGVDVRHPYPGSAAITATASRGLRAKVLLGVVGPLVASLGIFMTLEHGRHRTAVQSEMSDIAARSAGPLVDVLRHELAESDFDAVRRSLFSVRKGGEFRGAYLAAASGRVIFGPEEESAAGSLEKSQLQCRVCHLVAREARPRSVIVTAGDGERVFRSMHLLRNGPDCVGCHDAAERVLAVLVTDIPLASLEGRAAYDYHGNLVLWVAIVLGTGIVVNLVMRRLVTSRLAGVAQALERFGGGQHDLRLPADRPDEIGLLSAAFNEMGQRIQAEEARSRALAAEVHHHVDRQRELLKRLMTAQEEERRRVARDLHDDLGQDLAALAVGLEGADRLCAERPEQARGRLGEMRALIGDMTARAYDMILSLRPSVLDDMGLVPALRAHAERVLGRSGIRFDIDAGRLTRRMPPEIETAVFRTMQESLSNVVRHSGAGEARVSLATSDGMFEGEVVDDGRGFDVGSVATNRNGARGLGLLGMEERVALCGGTLEVLSSPGAGTRVRIRIPLAEATHD